VASRDIAADEEILRERAYTVAPRGGQEPVCLTCYRRVTGRNRCPGCSWPVCGAECSRGAPHAAECDVFRLVSAHGPEALAERGYHTHHLEVVAAVRCLLNQVSDPKKWRSLVEKFGNRHHSASSDISQLQNHQAVFEPLKTVLRIDLHPQLKNIPDTVLHQTLWILQVYSIPSRSTYGEISGLFPMASLLSHSCVPNVKTRFQGDQLILTAAEDIAAGTPLTALFTDMLWGTAARRDHLLTARCISCSCRRCEDPSELGSHFSAVKCASCGGATLPRAPLDAEARWECMECRQQVEANEVMNLNFTLGSEASQELTNPTIKGLEALLDRWVPKVHEHHYHLHAVKHTLLQLYGRTPDGDDKKDETYWLELAKKEKLCQEFLKVCSTLDPSMAHSISQFGLGFYELHKSVLEFAKRNFSKGELEIEQLKKKILLAKALLKRSMDILQSEAEDTQEGLLYARCEEEFISIGQWMFANELT